VIAAGAFRTGSTLQYNLAKFVIQEIKGKAYGFQNGSKASVEAYNDNDQNWTLTKQHRYKNIKNIEKGGAKIFFMLRDPRDVYSSVKKFNVGSMKRQLDMRERLNVGYNKLKNTSASILKYEDYYDKPRELLDEMLNYMNISLKSAIRNEIAEKCSIKGALKFIGDKDTKLDVDDIMNSNRLLHKNHISCTKGKPGAWKKELSKEEIKWVNNKYKEIIDKFYKDV
jgi:hypothetical protein